MPNWIIGFIALAFGMTFGWLVHGVAPAGNLLTILLFTLVYVFVTTGIGMVISNYSDTMQQAMFVMFFPCGCSVPLPLIRCSISPERCALFT